MKTKTILLLILGASLLALSSARPQTTFTKITDGDLVNTPAPWVGGTWADFNHDGFFDVVICSASPSASPQVNSYYTNKHDGTFSTITQGDPVEDFDHHVFPAAGDYDNDGKIDLFITAAAFSTDPTHNRLYHNNGDGTFSQASGGVVTNHIGHFGPAAWGDYDGDGFLDLFVASHGDVNPTGGKNLLYHNMGDGTFTNVTSGPVVNDLSLGYGAGWTDYDNDGLVDLLVVNILANGRNFLYHNNGDGTFTRVSNGPVASDIWPQGAACGAWGDYDNDGLPDLFVTDANGTRNQLYHNLGGGAFARVNSGPELQPPAGGASNGCSWGDYDNDGYLDLFVSGVNGTNALFHNKGDGTFAQIFTGDPVQDGGPGAIYNSVSWVDYDNDGFLDLFVTSATGANLLYHKEGNSNGWLEVKLVGTVANRSAIGAKVRVQATIGGKSFWQLREINGGVGYDSKPLVAHFGLGDATNVETLRIEWPSRTVQEFHNITPKQILTITESPRLLTTVTNGTSQFLVKGGRFMEYEVEASSDLVAWSPIGALTITNLNGTAQIVDTNAPSSGRKFYRALQR